MSTKADADHTGSPGCSVAAPGGVLSAALTRAPALLRDPRLPRTCALSAWTVGHASASGALRLENAGGGGSVSWGR